MQQHDEPEHAGINSDLEFFAPAPAGRRDAAKTAA